MYGPEAEPKFKGRSKNCLSWLRKRSGFVPPRRAYQAHSGQEARVGTKDQITRTLGGFPEPARGLLFVESLGLAQPTQQLYGGALFQTSGGGCFGVGIFKVVHIDPYHVFLQRGYPIGHCRQSVCAHAD